MGPSGELRRHQRRATTTNLSCRPNNGAGVVAGDCVGSGESSGGRVDGATSSVGSWEMFRCKSKGRRRRSRIAWEWLEWLEWFGPPLLLMCCCPGNWEARRAQQGEGGAPCDSRFAQPPSLARRPAKDLHAAELLTCPKRLQQPRLDQVHTPPWLHNPDSSRQQRTILRRRHWSGAGVGFNVEVAEPGQQQSWQAPSHSQTSQDDPTKGV